MKEFPSLATLDELLLYDPSTGILTWRERHQSYFTNRRSYCAWNGRFAGKEALTGITDGYKSGHILSSRYYAHRVGYYMYHRDAPTLIDHVNGDRLDNRIENLRVVNYAENMKNLGIRNLNTHGVLGISQHPKDGKWQACINQSGRKIYLGRFGSLAEAVAARSSAERVLGFHENHGKRKATQRHQQP